MSWVIPKHHEANLDLLAVVARKGEHMLITREDTLNV